MIHRKPNELKRLHFDTGQHARQPPFAKRSKSTRKHSQKPQSSGKFAMLHPSIPILKTK
jgi:hypothetical protein